MCFECKTLYYDLHISEVNVYKRPGWFDKLRAKLVYILDLWSKNSKITHQFV